MRAVALTSAFQSPRSAVACLVFLLSVFCAGLPNFSILHAENSDIDRTDIIASIEQAQLLVKNDLPEQAIKQLVKAYNLADSNRDYIGSATLALLIGEFYEHRGRLQQALIQYEKGLTILANRHCG